MNILAIETSTKNLSLAIANEDGVQAEYKGDAILKHSQDLIPNIEALLSSRGLALKDISCFALSIGPGSFTGLRVGVAILKGLNFVTGIPIVAVPTLDVIADNAKNEGLPICVLVDAKKKNLYSCLYEARDGNIIRVWDYLLISLEDLFKRVDGKTLFIGDGVALYGDTIKKRLKQSVLADRECWFPDVKTVARFGMEKCKKGEFEDPDNINPLYLYSQECNVKGVYR